MDRSKTNHQNQEYPRGSLIKHTWYGSVHPDRQKTDDEIKAEISLRLRKRERYQEQKGESVFFASQYY